ncbi:hypothetical protein WJX72_012406 [[Myrmecia] bisecta]|uniref:Uncharacterized protein n=1 Tax=[Myrmecia] bisecta TaxID=41462 RepID=A0AAW1PBW2_9CHLO
MCYASSEVEEAFGGRVIHSPALDYVTYKDTGARLTLSAWTPGETIHVSVRKTEGNCQTTPLGKKAMREAPSVWERVGGRPLHRFVHKLHSILRLHSHGSYAGMPSV